MGRYQARHRERSAARQRGDGADPRDDLRLRLLAPPFLRGSAASSRDGADSPPRPLPDHRDALETHPGTLLTMFGLRYHVASLAAVFVALAVGILLGVAVSGKVTDV